MSAVSCVSLLSTWFFIGSAVYFVIRNFLLVCSDCRLLSDAEANCVTFSVFPSSLQSICSRLFVLSVYFRWQIRGQWGGHIHCWNIERQRNVKYKLEILSIAESLQTGRLDTKFYEISRASSPPGCNGQGVGLATRRLRVWLSQAKFHHAIWSQTGWKLVADLQRAEIWPIV